MLDGRISRGPCGSRSSMTTWTSSEAASASPSPWREDSMRTCTSRTSTPRCRPAPACRRCGRSRSRRCRVDRPCARIGRCARSRRHRSPITTCMSSRATGPFSRLPGIDRTFGTATPPSGCSTISGSGSLTPFHGRVDGPPAGGSNRADGGTRRRSRASIGSSQTARTSRAVSCVTCLGNRRSSIHRSTSGDIDSSGSGISGSP